MEQKACFVYRKGCYDNYIYQGKRGVEGKKERLWGEAIMSKQRGFTLIELLVVISIIALLMAMLMPALAKVKDQAKTVACQADLSSWKVAWSMFLEDNGGHFMDHPTKWIPYMEPYFKDF